MWLFAMGVPGSAMVFILSSVEDTEILIGSDNSSQH
jgi:hypothetical protein